MNQKENLPEFQLPLKPSSSEKFRPDDIMKFKSAQTEPSFQSMKLQQFTQPFDQTLNDNTLKQFHVQYGTVQNRLHQEFASKTPQPAPMSS